jgi:uncharacterized protein YacL
MMNLNMLVRLGGLVVGGLAGWNLSLYLTDLGAPPGIPGAAALVLLGALLGLVALPYLTLVPLGWFIRRVRLMAALDLLAATVGLILGLVVAALISIPLSQLPEPWGRVLPTLAALLFGYLGLYIMVGRRNEFIDILGGVARPGAAEAARPTNPDRYILVDTSAIIDGRIADISQTGFVDGVLLIPRFVLNELQRIADSADSLRRNRGRRGLEMLNRLQKDSLVPIQISEIDTDGVNDVDGKLVKIARLNHYPVITNDYNLNRVAELQGVRVLNINELANAVKPAVLPGEDMRVRIISEGKELGQGVGYLDDGTMIVVENGRRWIDKEVEVTVTRVLQTVAGRMIFATMKDTRDAHREAS